MQKALEEFWSHFEQMHPLQFAQFYAWLALADKHS